MWHRWLSHGLQLLDTYLVMKISAHACAKSVKVPENPGLHLTTFSFDPWLESLE